MNNIGILRFSNFPAEIVKGLDENKNVLPIKTASSVVCRAIQEGCFTRCSLAGRVLSIVPIALLTCAASVLAIAESVASLAYAIFLTTLHTLTFFRSQALQNHTVKCWSYFFNSSALIISPALLLSFTCRNDDFERRIGLDLLHINCAQAAHSMGRVFDFFACRREIVSKEKVYAAAIQGTAQFLNTNASYLGNARIYDLGHISAQSVKRFLENEGETNNTLYPYKDYVLSHLTAYGVRMIARGMIRKHDQEVEAREDELNRLQANNIAAGQNRRQDDDDRYFDWRPHLNQPQPVVQDPPVPQPQQNPAMQRAQQMLANVRTLLDRPIFSGANNNQVPRAQPRVLRDQQEWAEDALDAPVNPGMNQQNKLHEVIKADKEEISKDAEKTKLPELVGRPLREDPVSTWTYQSYLTDYILKNGVRNFYANEDLLDYILLDGEKQTKDISVEERAVMNNANREERVNDIKDNLAQFMGPLYELSRFLALEEVADIAMQMRDSNSDCVEHLECPDSMKKRWNLLRDTVNSYKKLLDKGEDQILQLKKALVSGDNSSDDKLMKKIYVNIGLLGRDYVETNGNGFDYLRKSIVGSLAEILHKYEPKYQPKN